MTAKGRTIRALVVQENSARRTQLVTVLQRDGDICVVRQAATAAEAIQGTEHDRPDVIIVDLRLRGGISQQVIEQVMAQRPTPILVLSTRDDDRSPSAVEALAAGAVDALPASDFWTPDREQELRHSVRQLRKVVAIRHPRGNLIGTGHPHQRGGADRAVVAIAASTGGPSALAQVLSGLGGLPAPVLIVQHLHPDFTDGLLSWMSRASALPVQMAEQGRAAEAGHVYLAPGERHLRLGPGRRLELDRLPDTPHRPSADQLFQSVAEQAGSSAVGVLLTGMGSDGAEGLLQIHQQGGRTLAQDEATCAVFGMPRAAQLLGAVRDLLPLEELATAIGRAIAEIRA